MTQPIAPRAASHDRILDASLPLFAAEGFKGVSMRDVASAVGMTPAALYYHFPDKEQLYQALIARVFSDRLPPLIEQMAEEGDPGQRLEGLIHGLLSIFHTEPELLRLGQWVMLDTDSARTRQLAENVFRPFLEAVTSLVADLDDAFNPHRLSVSVIALVMFPAQSSNVMSHLPGFHRPEEDTDALARHIMRLLNDGIGTRRTE